MKILALVILLFPGLASSQFSGNALVLDGDNDFVNIPHQAGLSFGPGSPVTIELWLKPTGTPNIWHAFGKRNGCGSGAGINYQLARDTTSMVAFGSADCGLSLQQDLPVDEWSHLAITADGTKFRLYLNGQLAREKECTITGENTDALVIGNSDGCADSFPGLIDELRIWDTVRSDLEVEESFGCTYEKVPEGVIAYWKFDEDADSQQVLDSSGSGFDGTLGADSGVGGDDPTRALSTALFTEPLCVIFKDGFED